MESNVLAVVLGIVASFLFALAAYLQQRAARTTERRGSSVVGGLASLMARLLRSRTWLLGWGVNVAGFLAQAAALHVGSLATVQPLLATQLLFAMTMSCLELRRRPTLQDWASGLAICGGLALLLVSVGGGATAGEPDRSRILLAAVLVLLLILGVLSASRRLRPGLVNVYAAAAAGLCFAMSAVFMKLTGDDLLRHGVGHTATDWVGYALAASTLLGLVLEQGAFANGPLPWAIATTNSVNPVASFALGVLAFPFALSGDAGTLAALAGAAVLVVAGAIGLAHSPSARLWLRRPDAMPDAVGSGPREAEACAA